MDWFVVEMQDQDGEHFAFECEAESPDEAESIANGEHEDARAVSVSMA